MQSVLSMGLATFTFPLVVVFGLTRGKKLSSLFFFNSYTYFLRGSFKKVYAATSIWWSLTPVSQIIVFLKHFGLFARRISIKVPLMLLKQVSDFTIFFKSKLSIKIEKWLLTSHLESKRSVFKSPAKKILSDLLQLGLSNAKCIWKKTTYFPEGVYTQRKRHHFS